MVETKTGVVAVLYVLMVIEVVFTYCVVTIPGVLIVQFAVIQGAVVGIAIPKVIV